MANRQIRQLLCRVPGIDIDMLPPGGYAFSSMDQRYEATYHRLEERHWWFRARRDAVRTLVRSLCPARESSILEIGCSSGVLIQQLQAAGYRNLVGIDISVEAIRSCHERSIQNVRTMDAQQLDFPSESFDLITASDVLEHLQDDAAALREWWRVLRPGGHAIIFVPAFASLWSEHDVMNHHFRRYRVPELAGKATAAGLEVTRKSYWNSALFFPIASVRYLKKMSGRNNSASGASDDLFLPPKAVNSMLYCTLTFENSLFLRGANLPVGVSAMVIARKPG